MRKRRAALLVFATVLLSSCINGQDNPDDPTRTPVKIQTIDEYDTVEKTVTGTIAVAARAAAEASGGTLSAPQDSVGSACNEYVQNGRSVDRAYDLRLPSDRDPRAAVATMKRTWQNTSWPKGVTAQNRAGLLRVEGGPGVRLYADVREESDGPRVVLGGKSTCMQLTRDVRTELELRDLRTTTPPP